MPDFWNALFSSSKGNCANIEFRQLSKGSRPFLLLPRERATAAITLELYPAQTARARTAKSLLRFLIRIGLPIGANRISLCLSRDDEFVKFLSAHTGSPADLPRFGVFAGNPAHDTQRLIILLFDQNERPVAAVKAGFSGPAKSLIEKERQFLFNIPPNTRGIPKLRGSFADQRVKAFAMDFVEGQSPRSDDRQPLASLLSSWISANGQIALHQTAAWQQLEKTCSLFQRHPALHQLRDRKIQPAIQHGDFAPWNVKIAPADDWTVLDWERGDLNGIPAWDWFHYLIQTAILVEHNSVDEIAQRLDTLFASADFKTYSQKSNIHGIERELAVAYLIHLTEVIKPAEGSVSNLALLKTLCQQWFKRS
jgi:hypothetical protein